VFRRNVVATPSPSGAPALDTIARLNASLAGHYTIVRELGAGGMATVYLARDLKHDRDVAIKVLKPELAAVLGGERFVVEIKTTASLQHPHILPLFDSGTADGFLYYVMPYILGETIREKLNRETQFGVDEAVRIAREVSDALDCAHRHGVIHRDIKPENILLHDGRPMVMDFGIALAVSAAAGGRMTETGLSLGTPHYMSPEQATAEREITPRSDIYSLASVLYEMLAGQPPHIGGSAQQVIMKIITEPAQPVTTLRKSVPPNVAAAVAKSLEKLPADRFESAKAFGDALGNPAFAARSSADAASTSAVRLPSRSREAVLIVTLVVALAGWAWSTAAWRRAPDAADDPVMRVQLTLPQDVVPNDALVGPNVAISPRGDQIVFLARAGSAGGNNAWIRAADQLESRSLTAIGTSLRNPCFSPDGKWVAFSDGYDIKKISVNGGPIVTLSTIGDLPNGLNWGSGGFLVSGSQAGGLYLIPERGGAVRALPKASGEGAGRWPLFLPDAKTIVYHSVREGGRSASGLWTVDVADGKRTALDVQGTSPLAYRGGQLIYATYGGALMAIPFDGHRATGTAVPLVSDVVIDNLGGAKASMSATGALVYRSGKAESQPVIVRGAPAPLIPEPRNFSTPRFSPDGKRVAFTVTSPEATDVWVYDRSRATLTKVTSDGLNERPEWTADGKRLVFVSARGGVNGFWWQPADGSAPAELLYTPLEGDPYEAMLSHDGHWLIYRTGPAGKPPRSAFAVPLDGDRKSIALVAGKSYVQMPRLSPDGHWLAYQDNASGVFEIYVRPFPGLGGRVQVSSGGGNEPVWAESGHALYYRTGRDLVRVAVTLGASLGIGERKIALSGDYLTNASHPNYDVSPDGSEILMLRRAGDDVLTVVVHNWMHEVLGKVAAQNGK
jgi:serine/threonine protein kinase/Tol biopolymer transport system component